MTVFAADKVAASVISQKRTIGADVAATGFVSHITLFSDAVTRWDRFTLGDRICQVAAVAHLKFRAALPADQARPGSSEVEAAQKQLKF